ncbi:MAG: LysR substrate-binding domain-containing protein [Nakamurella sp.]
MIDVRRLRALSELAAQGSFSAAAATLGMTQSAVSQQIAALERDVGQAVVRRGTRPVELTEAGSVLDRHARGILARLETAEQEVAEVGDRRRGRLRFGCFPTVLGTLMPAAFARFHRMHPDVRLTVVDDHLHRLVPRLESGELDLAVIYEHPALPDIGAGTFERAPLLADRFAAVLPAGHPLNRQPVIGLQDLRGETWIGGAPSSSWYRIVRHACQQVGFIPQADIASDDYIAVQALVAAGLGVSVIPGLALKHPLPGVVVRQLASAAPVRRICAAWPVDGYRGPAVDAMIDSLRLTARVTA